MHDAIDPGLEERYWSTHFSSRPYVRPGTAYEAYRTAYRYGWESRGRYGELNWEGVEPRLREEWPSFRGDSTLDWDEASRAARDAWDRISPAADYRAENR